MHITPAAIVRLNPTQAQARPRDLQGGLVSAHSQNPQIQRRPPLEGGAMAQRGGALGTIGLSHPGGWEVEEDSKESGTSIWVEAGSEDFEPMGSQLAQATMRWEAKRLVRLTVGGLQKNLQKFVDGSLYVETTLERNRRELMEKVWKALNSCQTQGVENPLVVRHGGAKEGQNHHSVMGLFGCGSGYCVHCARIEAAARAKDAYEGASRWTSLGRRFRIVTVTLTIPNAPYASRIEMIEIAKGAFRRLVSDHGGKQFRAILNHAGWLRVLEIMHKVNEGTCHPHFHLAIFVELDEELSEDDMDDFNLNISEKIHALWENKVRSFVAKKRTGDCNYGKWIDLNKEIIQKPYFEELKFGPEAGKKTGRIKGGVVAEVCKNNEAFARYLAKEMAFVGEKLSRNGKSMNWQGLLRISYKGNLAKATPEEKRLGALAGKAFIEHVITTHKVRSWEWSRGKDRKSFLNHLREITEELPEKEEKLPVIVAAGDKDDVAWAVNNDPEFHAALDRADQDPEGVNLEAKTGGVLRNVKNDEESQKRQWERFKKQLRDVVVRMQEGAKRSREKRQIQKELAALVRRE